MKTTIKQKAIKFIGGDSKGNKRTDVVYYILVNNGRLKVGDYERFLTDYNTKWRGYYSDAFQQWEKEGLITRKKGIYKATELGKAYVQNSKIMREINNIRETERKNKRHILKDFRELQWRYNNLISQLDRIIINS